MTRNTSNQNTGQDRLSYEREYKSKSLQQRLFACAMEANVPVYLLGAPGIGKTEFISSYAKRNGYVFELLPAPHLEPGDITGLPVEASGSDGKFRTQFAEMQWIDNLNKGKKSILFIDELPLASDETKKALLSVIQGRKAGTHKIGDHVRIVAAGNPMSWSFESVPLSAPMRTRMLHIQWEFDANEWIRHHRDGYANWTPPAIPAGTKLMSEDVCRQLDGIFYDSGSQLIQATTLNDIDPEAPFNVARSWDNVYAIMRCIPEGDYDVLHAAMSGLVGESMATRVSALLRYNLPIREIIANPYSFDWMGESGDRVYAALLSITDRALDRQARNVTSEIAAEVFEAAANSGCADIAWGFLVRLMDEDPNYEVSQQIALTFRDYLEG